MASSASSTVALLPDTSKGIPSAPTTTTTTKTRRNVSIVQLLKRSDKTGDVDWDSLVARARSEPREVGRSFHLVLRKHPSSSVVEILLDCWKSYCQSNNNNSRDGGASGGRERKQQQQQRPILLRTYPHPMNGLIKRLKPMAIAAHTGCPADTVRFLVRATVEVVSESSRINNNTSSSSSVTTSSSNVPPAVFEDTEFRRLPIKALKIWLEEYPQGVLEEPSDSDMGTFASLFLAFGLCQTRPCDMWTSLKLILQAMHVYHHRLHRDPDDEASAEADKFHVVHSLLELVGAVEKSPAAVSSLDVLSFKSLEQAVLELLDEYVLMHDGKAFQRTDDQGRLPLHIVCQNSFGADRELEDRVAEDFDDGEENTNDNDAYSMQLVQYVLNANPDAIRQAIATTGQLPLHVALQHRLPWVVIEEMMKLHPDALDVLDPPSGMYPYQIAAAHQYPVGDIFDLLRTSPDPGVMRDRQPNQALLDSELYKQMVENERIMAQLMRQNHALRTKLRNQGLLSQMTTTEEGEDVYQYYYQGKRKDVPFFRRTSSSSTGSIMSISSSTS